MVSLPPPSSDRGANFPVSKSLHIFPSLQDKAGPPHPPAQNPDQEGVPYEDSDSDTEEPIQKKMRLVSDLPEQDFHEKFMIVSKSSSKKRKIPVVLPRKEKPEWLENLGEVNFKNDSWNLEIPDILVAHVAGYLSSNPRVFTVSSDASLLSDSFALISVKLNRTPSFVRINTYNYYDIVSHQIKALTFAWATALQLHKEEVKYQELLENVVYPGVAESVLALEATIRKLRSVALGVKMPNVLRFRYVNAPIDKLWPEDEKLEEDIRKFFRGKRAKAGRLSGGRGKYRGHRGSGNRGYFSRGQRSNRRRGHRGRGSGTNNPTTSQQSTSA